MKWNGKPQLAMANEGVISCSLSCLVLMHKEVRGPLPQAGSSHQAGSTPLTGQEVVG